MMNQKINTNSLNTGAMIKIAGEVEYSHITKVYTEEEFQRRAAEEAKRGNPYPKTRTYREITLRNPQIIAQNQNGFTLEESYVQSKIYDKKDGSKGYTFQTSGTNTNYFHIEGRDANGRVMNAEKFTPEGEFAKGTKVVLILNVFAPKTQGNKGIGLYSLVVDGPLEYFQGSNSGTMGLESLGIDVSQIVDNTKPVEEDQAMAEQPVVTNGFDGQAQAFDAQPNYQGQGFTANQPANGNGFTEQPFEPMNQQQGGQHAAPVQGGFGRPQEFVSDQGQGFTNNSNGASNPYSGR